MISRDIIGNMGEKIKTIKCIYPKEENKEAFNKRTCQQIINVTIKKLPAEYVDMIIEKLKK